MSGSIFGVSSTSTRVTGMMSGLDTDDFVKGMSGGLLNRIAKMQQQKQLLTWKMSAYQGVSSKLINFNDTYMSYASNLNALSSKFYTSRSVEASSDFVSVSGYSSTASQLSITNIKQYAVNAGFVSGKAAADTTINLADIDFGDKTINNIQGETIQIKLNNTAYNINIAEDADCSTNDKVVLAIEAALSKLQLADGTTLDNVIKVTNPGPDDGLGGGLQFDIDPAYEPDYVMVIADGTNKVLDALGLAKNMSTGKGDGPMSFGIVTADLTSTVNFNDTVKGKTMTFTLNGVSREIKMPGYDDKTPPSLDPEQDFIDELQAEFDRAFGVGRVAVDLTMGAGTVGSISLKAVKSGGANDDSAVLTLTSASGLVGFKTNTNLQVGASNRLNLSRSIKNQNFATPPTPNASGEFEIEVNGVPITISENDTLQQMLDKINGADAGVKVEYLATTNRFAVSATQDGAGGRVDIKDLNGGNFVTSLFGTKGADYTVTDGKDAVIEVSFGGNAPTEITRSTNTFDIDGLTITLNANKKWVSGDGHITFSVSNDVDDVYDRIVTLVEAFNEINDLVNSEIRTKYDREYPPLTADQRKEMTESEIKEWEEKAMQGLLNNDPTLRALSQELRFIFSFSVPGVGAISDFGISVSNKYLDFGKVVIDEDKLRAALEERPDDVAALFTTAKATGEKNGTSEQGIMFRIKDVYDKYATTTGAKKGSLITLAGIEGGSVLIQDKDIQIMRQIESIDKKLESLNMNLKIQQDRYYKQFTALEVYIAKMNMQSGWLMDFYS